MADAAHRDARLLRASPICRKDWARTSIPISASAKISSSSPACSASRAPSGEWRIAELLDSTGLAPFADRPAKKLSGGMRQKLGLCCSLIHDPDLADPRRADDRRRSAVAASVLGIDRSHARRAVPGMSVMVATAYMEEAERFDWLIAMNAGRVLAAGSPADLKAQTGRRHGRGGVHRAAAGGAARRPPPARQFRRARVADAEPVIVARDLTCRFGDFTAVDQVNFTIERGEIFGFVGSNGCGKTTTMKMLTGLLAAERRRGAAVRQAARCPRHRRARPRRLYVAIVLALHRADGAAESRAARAAVPSARAQERKRASPS